MDVARIEAFNPNRINWKILTAKEIIKYERQGVEVPDVYLQWAQEFISSVNETDSDNITYEAAKSEERHNSDIKDVSKSSDNNLKTSFKEDSEIEEKEITKEGLVLQ